MHDLVRNSRQQIVNVAIALHNMMTNDQNQVAQPVNLEFEAPQQIVNMAIALQNLLPDEKEQAAPPPANVEPEAPQEIVNVAIALQNLLMDDGEEAVNREPEPTEAVDEDPCGRYINQMLQCQLQYCCRYGRDLDREACNNLREFKVHLENCEYCEVVKQIDHARYCNKQQCPKANCEQIRRKLSNYPKFCCLYQCRKTLSEALLFNNDHHDYQIFIRELIDCNRQDENDAAASASGSATKELQSSKKRINGVKSKALSYWIHVHDCKDPKCSYAQKSISCERKRVVIKLHRDHCSRETCRQCILIDKFITDHTKTCHQKPCPIPRCNDIKFPEKKSEPKPSTSSGDSN